jgi:hypothetical protein
MPEIIEYSSVASRLENAGLKCHYHNSGAFGFADERGTHSRGWIGQPDPTIREAALPLVRQVPAPAAEAMTQLLMRAWIEHLGGEVWVMPKSHWAYELTFGNAAWLEPLLDQIGVPPASLQHRSDAAALSFTEDETAPLRLLVGGMLENLAGSDFLLLFLAGPTLCTIHHHRQIWWTSRSADQIALLDQLLPLSS